MSKKGKIVGYAVTDKGYQVKVWRDVKTGEMRPTHWKIQAGMLARPNQVKPVAK